jgi:hypothetical protein
MALQRLVSLLKKLLSPLPMGLMWLAWLATVPIIKALMQQPLNPQTVIWFADRSAESIWLRGSSVIRVK